MIMVRPLMISLKTTLRDDCAVSACSVPSPRPLSITALDPLVASRQGELAFRQMSAIPSPQWSASEIKQTFLSIHLACLLTLGQWASGSHILQCLLYHKMQNLIYFLSSMLGTQILKQVTSKNRITLEIGLEIHIRYTSQTWIQLYHWGNIKMPISEISYIEEQMFP